MTTKNIARWLVVKLVSSEGSNTAKRLLLVIGLIVCVTNCATGRVASHRSTSGLFNADECSSITIRTTADSFSAIDPLRYLVESGDLPLCTPSADDNPGIQANALYMVPADRRTERVVRYGEAVVFEKVARDGPMMRSKLTPNMDRVASGETVRTVPAGTYRLVMQYVVRKRCRMEAAACQVKSNEFELSDPIEFVVERDSQVSVAE